jgi:hypothetical protein
LNGAREYLPLIYGWLSLSSYSSRLTLFLVCQQELADPGKIVVALVDGEATVKKLAKGPGYYVLQPESTNPKNRPIIVAQDFRVQAVVCRVFKKEQCFECCDERLFS